MGNMIIANGYQWDFGPIFKHLAHWNRPRVSRPARCCDFGGVAIWYLGQANGGGCHLHRPEVWFYPSIFTIDIYTYMYICIRIYSMYIYIYIFNVYIYIHIDIFNLCIYIYMYIQCIYIYSMCIYIYIYSMYIYIYVYIQYIYIHTEYTYYLYIGEAFACDAKFVWYTWYIYVYICIYI